MGCAGIAAILVIGILALAGYELLVPYKGYSQDVFIELERGTTTKALAATLEQQGVIRSRYAFLIWRALHPQRAASGGGISF